ncbi:MAG TPA: hypothetical protein VK907_13175 [Phnomibacter sp.]|nr:hypothetical protein [Phnomibacter sp.]
MKNNIEKGLLTSVLPVGSTITGKANLLVLLFAVLFTASCKKEKVIPPVHKPEEITYKYFDLKDHQIPWWGSNMAIDVNGDKKAELFFTKQLVGDAINKVDKRQWLITSNFYTYLPVNAMETIPVLEKDSNIPFSNFNGYNWYNASSIVLIERVEDIHGHFTWNGAWLNHQKKFLPFQVLEGHKRYNGWVEISTDQYAEQIILHRAAISNAPNVDIIAGK